MPKNFSCTPQRKLRKMHSVSKLSVFVLTLLEGQRDIFWLAQEVLIDTQQQSQGRSEKNKEIVGAVLARTQGA